MSETPLEKKWKVAIIGSGPAAFYAASGLLKNKNLDFQVDMIEKLPTPYGLVRGGVAPDHQKIKSVMKIYERTALKENFRYFGNVTLGQDVQKEDLLKNLRCRHLCDGLSYGPKTQHSRGRRLGEPYCYRFCRLVQWPPGFSRFRI